MSRQIPDARQRECDRVLTNWAVARGMDLDALDTAQRWGVFASLRFLDFIGPVLPLRRVVAYMLSHSGMDLTSPVLAAAIVERGERAIRKARAFKPGQFWRRLRERSNTRGAAASLREGLAETLTVKRLGINRQLERILSTTKAIGNLIGAGRDLTSRVKRWKTGTMALRWMATAVQEAQKKFRRVMGYPQTPKLVAALEQQQERSLAGLLAGVDDSKRVA